MVTYRGESSLPAISDEEFAAVRAKARPYTACILTAGSKYEPPDSELRGHVAQIIWEHGRRNAAMHKAGLMPVICPISDDSELNGIGLFDLTPEEVVKVMDQDPGVQAGVFKYEIHPCFGILDTAPPCQ